MYVVDRTGNAAPRGSNVATNVDLRDQLRVVLQSFGATRTLNDRIKTIIGLLGEFVRIHRGDVVEVNAALATQ